MSDPLTGTPTLMRVTATNGLRMRSTPAGDVMRTLTYAEQVTAFLDSAVPSPGVTWVLVRDKNGTVGWTAKAYLAPLAAPPEPTPTPGTVTYTADEHARLKSAINDLYVKWEAHGDATAALSAAIDAVNMAAKESAPPDSGGGF